MESYGVTVRNPALLARALTNFAADPRMTSGRFSLIEVDGVEVVLDYGRNAAAVRALNEALTALGARRTVLVIGLPGDRRDEELIATLAVTRRFADEYVLYELEDRRGRAEWEVPQLLRRHLPADTPITYAPNQRAGIQQGWQRVRPGDRMILIIDSVDEAPRIARALGQRVRDAARRADRARASC